MKFESCQNHINSDEYWSNEIRSQFDIRYKLDSSVAMHAKYEYNQIQKLKEKIYLFRHVIR